MSKDRIERRSQLAGFLSIVLTCLLSFACRPTSGAGDAESFALLSAVGTESGVSLANQSSGLSDEDEYTCAFTDADETAGNAAGWKQVTVVSPSTDINGKYSAFKDLKSKHRNGIAIIEPTGAPDYEDTEYITFFSAGHQGPETFVLSLLFKGFPASVTGQRKEWASAWSNILSNYYFMQTCKAGLRNRMMDDAQTNGRLPVLRTYHTGAFDSHFSWADFKSTKVANAWVNHIKSLGNPSRIKGVYLAGSSMGGCLANYIGSELNKDPHWGKVPVIVQGGDPVCPNGYNSNSPAYLGIGDAEMQNPKLDDDSYFTYMNKTGGAYLNEFPNKERIKIYNILGGGNVTFINNARSFSIRDGGLLGADGVLNHTDGSYGGSFAHNQWFRQLFMAECHACLGRNWHHWIMGHGDATKHGMMRFYRDSYNDLNFWGAWVNFWTGEYIPGRKAYSGGLKHETPALQTRKVQLFADKNQADFLKREIVVPIKIMATSTATYGVDFDFLDQDKNPVVDYGSMYPGGAPGHGGFPASANQVFLKSNPGETPILYVRRPKTASGQNQGFFYIRILNDNVVESDEKVVLRIGNYPVLGRPRLDSSNYILTIRDHDRVPHTQETCEAAGGVWHPDGKIRCVFTATVSNEFEHEFMPSTGDGGTTVGTCAENGETWRSDSQMCVLKALPSQDRSSCAAARGEWDGTNCRAGETRTISQTAPATSRESAPAPRRYAN